MVNRRAFVAGCVGVFAARLSAEAQQAGKVRRIAVIASGAFPSTPPGQGPFYERLRELGWVYGRDLVAERRAYGDRMDNHLRRSNFAGQGGLMSYGYSFRDTQRSAAETVDKILRGAKAGDVPIQQVTTFNLVINLKTAKALGLTIPRSLLLRADQVIEQ
jgi:ABC transporter substrate binding protein